MSTLILGVGNSKPAKIREHKPGVMYDTTKPYKDRVKEIIRSTWEPCPRIAVLNCDSEYPLFRSDHNEHFFEIDHTDGIGSKGMLHWYNDTFLYAVQDALAMNINDLTTARAIPFKLQNHLTIPEDDHNAVTAILAYMASECIERGIAMTGGEISIQDNLQGMELSVTMTGCTDKYHKNVLAPDDTLIGLPSSGLHANGFTKVRQLFAKHEWEAEPLASVLTTPTRIYDLQHCWSKINGIVHIAGGGFTRLKQYLKEAQANIWCDVSIPNIFTDLWRLGVTPDEMYRTFNCGVGMVLSVSPENTKEILDKTGGFIMGRVYSAGKEEVGKVLVESWIGANKQLEL